MDWGVAAIGPGGLNPFGWALAGAATPWPLLAATGPVHPDPASLGASSQSFAVLAIGVALMGACVGSFLNVVAWRLPRQESVVLPPSHCPHCGSRLAWFENIPVLGWLALRGRCRHCGAAISPRYPAVELLSAGLWVAILLATPPLAAPGGAAAAGLPGAAAALAGSSALAGGAPWLGSGPIDWWLLAAGWLLASLLLPMVLIDLDHLWLPEPLCRWGLVLGLAITAIAGYRHGPSSGGPLLLDHLIAAAAGLLAMEGLSALAQRLMGKPALGLGDAKLTALLGAWLGLYAMAIAVFLAFLSGALLGSALMLVGRLKRGQPFPFGPYLAAGGLAVWIGGASWWGQVLGGALGGG
jgi:leader peptidase (prepilin peptidase)/N-methyltransferase